MSMGNGGTTTVTTSGKSYPQWANWAVKQYFQDALMLAITAFPSHTNEYGTYKGAYPSHVPSNYSTHPSATGYTYAGQDTNETGGIGAIAARAVGGGTAVAVQKGKTLLTNNLAGTNLLANTKLDAVYTKLTDEIIERFDTDALPDIAQECNNIGRFGGSSHALLQFKAADSSMKDLNSTGEKVYYEDWKSARTIEMASLVHAIRYGKETIRDWEMLRLSGVYQREFVQGAFEDFYKNYQTGQQLAVAKLEIFGNAVRMLKGTQNSKIEPYYRMSDFTQMAGLAMAGMGLYARIKTGSEPSIEAMKTIQPYKETDVSQTWESNTLREKFL